MKDILASEIVNSQGKYSRSGSRDTSHLRFVVKNLE